jgi:hypothetical protein
VVDVVLATVCFEALHAELNRTLLPSSGLEHCTLTANLKAARFQRKLKKTHGQQKMAPTCPLLCRRTRHSVPKLAKHGGPSIFKMTDTVSASALQWDWHRSKCNKQQRLIL